MKRETRLNVIFLVIFVAVSLPGAVILFRKKMDPSAPRMDQPDPVVRQMPYMAPPPAPPGVRWMVPTLTRDWLGGITHGRMGTARMYSALPEGPDWEPVISADHRVQVVGMLRERSSTVVGMVLWGPLGQDNPDALLASVGPVTAGVAATAGRVSQVEQLAVPENVRRELVGLGYNHPPTHVTWISAEFPQHLTEGDDVRLSLDDPRASPPLYTSVEFVVR